jgi:hypothetical protein
MFVDLGFVHFPASGRRRPFFELSSYRHLATNKLMITYCCQCGITQHKTLNIDKRSVTVGGRAISTRTMGSFVLELDSLQRHVLGLLTVLISDFAGRQQRCDEIRRSRGVY